MKFELIFIKSRKSLNQLQVIQNAALRAILCMPFNQATQKHASIALLHEIVGLPYKEVRLSELSEQYLINALLDKTPSLTNATMNSNYYSHADRRSVCANWLHCAIEAPTTFWLENYNFKSWFLNIFTLVNFSYTLDLGNEILIIKDQILKFLFYNNFKLNFSSRFIYMH